MLTIFGEAIIYSTLLASVSNDALTIGMHHHLTRISIASLLPIKWMPPLATIAHT